MHFKAILASTLKCTLVGSILISQSVNPISAIAVYRRAENPASTVAVQINSPSETPASAPQDISEPAQFSRHADDAAGPEDAQAAQIFNEPEEESDAAAEPEEEGDAAAEPEEEDADAAQVPEEVSPEEANSSEVEPSSNEFMPENASVAAYPEDNADTADVEAAGSKHHGRRSKRRRVRYTRTRRNFRKRIAVLRDRLKMGGKKGSKKAYGLTYFHKKTNYPAGSAVTTPEEDITYKKVHASGNSGVMGAKLKERFRLLADKRKRRSRRKIRIHH